MIGALEDGGRVELRGFGAFSVRAARAGPGATRAPASRSTCAPSTCPSSRAARSCASGSTPTEPRIAARIGIDEHPQEFREFIARGNVVDLAVGVIIGGAFGNIVNSLVDQVIMPPIGLLTRRRRFRQPQDRAQARRPGDQERRGGDPVRRLPQHRDPVPDRRRGGLPDGQGDQRMRRKQAEAARRARRPDRRARRC